MFSGTIIVQVLSNRLAQETLKNVEELIDSAKARIEYQDTKSM